jgi:hypothetical protein
MFNYALFKKILKILLAFIAVLAAVCLILFWIGKPQKNIIWGLSFSTIRAQELGFEPQNLLATILDDMHPAKIRIPVYWSEIEPQQGLFDFSKYEGLLTETNKRGTEVILVLGRKQPRWPECHQPGWFNQLTSDQQDIATLNMIEKSVAEFKDIQSVVAWQIENEPYFQYGPVCPVTSHKLYEKELNLVAQLDEKPTIATDSGEKGVWVNVAWSGANVLGATMYREVYHDKKGKYISYKFPWWSYNIKSGLVKLLTNADDVIGVELQAEPWLIVSNPSVTAPEEQLQHMNPDIFRNNIEYAKKVGLAENYLWGAEWWYWMAKQHNDDSMVNAAKEFFNQK